jgi:hypothetical protein
MPGAVGGDYKETQVHDAIATDGAMGAGNMSSEDGRTGFHLPLPDKELYVRWLQLATFLPVIRYTHLPSKYGDEHVLEMAKVFTALRLKTVSSRDFTLSIHLSLNIYYLLLDHQCDESLP